VHKIILKSEWDKNPIGEFLLKKVGTKNPINSCAFLQKSGQRGKTPGK
jgi:hypothetical protein